MDELTQKINTMIEEFKVHSGRAAIGNKAAARRARKNTLELEKAFKEYRKLSVAEIG